MIRNLYAYLYRMSVEHPVRFIKLAIVALAIGVMAVCMLIVGVDELVKMLAH
ncbi:MAG: hypothetical protein JWM53_2783 [bacterium]|nr:hypothetical protein [bacterium]